MLALFAAVVLSAAPQTKLAAPGLTGVGLSQELTTFYSDHLAQMLGDQGLTVMTASQISSLLGFERQKQLMGCDEDSSCMAELANALGVDGIVGGSIGRFDGLFQINVKVVSASDGRKLGIHSGTANSEGEVLAAMKVAAASIAEQVQSSLGRGATKPGIRRYWFVPGAIAVVGAIFGSVMFALANGEATALKNADSTLLGPAAQAHRNSGVVDRTAGIIGFAVAGAALLTAGGFALFGGPVTVTPTLAPGSGGVSLQGRLP